VLPPALKLKIVPLLEAPLLTGAGPTPPFQLLDVLQLPLEVTVQLLVGVG
jgi:hypothetical protein